jgi:nitrite reductase (NADH) small subunit
MTTLDSDRRARPLTAADVSTWIDVIAETELPPEIGVPALVGRMPVAVFRTHDGAVHALSNLDPKSGASVMARGIVGSRGDVPTVASPLYKHVFDLRTGRCLDDDSLALARYEARVNDGVVQVRGVAG